MKLHKLTLKELFAGISVVGILFALAVSVQEYVGNAPSAQELAEAIPEHVDTTLVGADRSSHWQSFRNHEVVKVWYCEACGVTETLNAHHVKPFHIDPALELDPTNIIILCREHHFTIGHKGNWKNSDPTVREDSARMLKKRNPQLFDAWKTNPNREFVIKKWAKSPELSKEFDLN